MKKPESRYIQGICCICNTNKQHVKGRSLQTGEKVYGSKCSGCYKKLRGLFKGKYKYRKYKKDICEYCGFIPINKCQLDVDHIDNNHKNNELNNLQTLCANCHRLKTFINRQNIHKTKVIKLI